MRGNFSEKKTRFKKFIVGIEFNSYSGIFLFEESKPVQPRAEKKIIETKKTAAKAGRAAVKTEAAAWKPTASLGFIDLYFLKINFQPRKEITNTFFFRFIKYSPL